MSDPTFHESNGYLLSQVCKLYRAVANRSLEEIGMHKGQEMILCELCNGDGLTQSDLVERLMVQPSTLTNALNSMEKSGFIARQPDPDDQRVSRVYMTEKAHEVWPQLKEVWDSIDAQAFGNLSIEERIVLRRLLMQVYDNLSDQG